MGSIANCIKRDKARVFRRLYMKRRETTGEYESNWQTIPSKYIKTWGSVDFSTDEVLPIFIDVGGFNFTVLNNDGYFSGVTSDQSFFYGKLSRFRTLVKVEAGYIDTDDMELPTTSTLFLGVLGEDMKHQENNEIQCQVKSLCSLFQEFKADEISGLNVTLTATQIIGKIRDYTDTNAVAVFQKYISVGGWHIAATTRNYNMLTSTSLQNMNCWDLIKNLAGAEQCLAYIDRTGDFYFRLKTDVTATSSFRFSGLDDQDKTYGHNIIGHVAVDDGIRQVYNRINIKFAEDDTTTSYLIKRESWAWGDSSSSFRFGVREYKYENYFLLTATAQTIADNLYTEYSEPKQQIELKCKFVPQLMLLDLATIYYRTRFLLTPSLWSHFLWGEGKWGIPYGYNLNLNGDYKIIKLTHNLGDFSSNITLRQL